MSTNKTKIQNDIVKDLDSIHGLLILAPRLGKTRIAIKIIQEKLEKPKKILWVTENTKLRDVDLPNEFKTWNAEDKLKITKFVCYQSLHKIKGNYDLIILDEFQFITLKNCVNLLNKSLSATNILGLSGTYPNSFNKQAILKSLKLKPLKNIDINSAIEENLIADYDITVVEIELDDENKNIKSGRKDKYFYQTEKSKYNYLESKLKPFHKKSVDIHQRNHFLYSLPSRTNYIRDILPFLSGRTLIFCGTIKQSKEITPYIYNSSTDSMHYDNFQKGKLSHLALVNKGAVGHTYRNVNNLIISKIEKNSLGNVTQRIARALVKQKDHKANVILFKVKNTVEDNWIKHSLKDFSEKNIRYISYVDFLNELKTIKNEEWKNEM